MTEKQIEQLIDVLDTIESRLEGLGVETGQLFHDIRVLSNLLKGNI